MLRFIICHYLLSFVIVIIFYHCVIVIPIIFYHYHYHYHYNIIFIVVISRLNFVYTLLSKRKLTWFVEKGLVTGWDDPRFPTVRGIRRRGMTIDALKEYILLQGASKNTLVLTWDKIWAINKQKIDPVAPRYTTVDKEGSCVKVVIEGAPSVPELKSNPLHKKNPDIGVKDTVYFKNIYLDALDGKDLVEGEEVTLMDWGNIIITKRVSDLEVHAKLHLEGDFKKTKKKLTWLAESSSKHPWLKVHVHDYDYLITKPKLEENDELSDNITPTTEFITEARGDWNMKSLKKGKF